MPPFSLVMNGSFELLGLLTLALKAWMAIDAYQSGNDRLIFLILFIPFGEWIYLLTFKVRDPRLQRYLKQLKPKSKANLELMRREAERSPSLRNKQLLADALFDARRYKEAQNEYEALLKSMADDKQILFRIAQCLQFGGDPRSGLPILVELVSKDPKFNDYRAAIELAKLYRQLGEATNAVSLLQGIGEANSRIDLRLELARSMIDASQDDQGSLKPQAAALLDDLMADFRTSPAFFRRENGKLFREARKLRRSIP